MSVDHFPGPPAVHPQHSGHKQQQLNHEQAIMSSHGMKRGGENMHVAYLKQGGAQGAGQHVPNNGAPQLSQRQQMGRFYDNYLQPTAAQQNAQNQS